MHSHQRFIENAERVMAGTKKERHSYILFYFDITNFEAINQIYGLKAGDRVLLEAEKMGQGFPESSLCSRVFSDHFLCLSLIRDSVSKEEILEQCDKRAQMFLAHQEKNFPNCKLKIACGICMVHAGRLVSAMDEANIARKESKKEGSNHAVWFDRSMQAYLEKRYEKEKEINIAMREKRVCFFLQPKVNLETGEIIGAEALSRGITRTGKIVGPGYFLPIMEAEGTITELDFLICQQVCSYMAQRIQEGKPVVCTSVNLSRLHLYDPETADQLHQLVSSYGIPPKLIEFELTENIFLNEFDSAKNLIEKLRNYGYQVSIDDFGSGYAGINIWQEFDFDVLKLDRKFLEGREEAKKRNEALLPNLVDISKRLEITVLGEGVETREQCEYLAQIGCDVAQGFFFSKPVPAEDFYETYQLTGGRYSFLDRNEAEAEEKQQQTDQGNKEEENIWKKQFLFRNLFHNRRSVLSILSGLAALLVIVGVILLQFRHYAISKFYKIAEQNDFATGSYTSAMIRYGILTTVLVALVVVAFVFFFIRWLVKNQQELEYERKQYDLLAEFYDTVLFQYDVKKDSIRFTPNAREVFQIRDLQQKDFIRDLPKKFIFEADRKILMDTIENKDSREGEMRIRLRKPNSDEYFWTLFQYKYLLEDDEPAYIIGKLLNIDEQQEREQKLIEQAILDSGTGLLKKEEVKHSLNRMLPDEKAGFFILMDIDDFKKINDTLGHSIGDVAIKNLADALKKEFRKADLIGRFGGDEFVVFASGMMDRDKLKEKFETIFQLLKADRSEAQVPITISAGVACYPQDGKDYDSLLRNADMAMYEAKRRGKNQIVFSDYDIV